MNIESIKEQAKRILAGDSDNYDGADGARIIIELCEEIERLRIVDEDDYIVVGGVKCYTGKKVK